MKTNYYRYSLYINLARILATQGNCKKRNYGCIIMSPSGNVISTGYTHSTTPCEKCKRRFSRSGHNYEKCTSIHAEQEAIAGVEIPEGSIAFLACFDTKTKKEIANPRPCPTCMRLLHQAGVRKVITYSEVIDI